MFQATAVAVVTSAVISRIEVKGLMLDNNRLTNLQPPPSPRPPLVGIWSYAALDKNGLVCDFASGSGGHITNRRHAEYYALIQALCYVQSQGLREIPIRIAQRATWLDLIGKHHPSGPLLPLYGQVRRLIMATECLIEWQPGGACTVSAAQFAWRLYKQLSQSQSQEQ